MSSKTPLNEYITLQRGFDLPKNKRNESGCIPVIAATGVNGYHDEIKVRAPGVVIGRSGSIGGGQYIEKDFWPLNTTLWVKDFKGHNPLYIYYLLRSIDFQRLNVGTGVPTLNRNHLGVILVSNFKKDQENKIAKILGDLDKKIELNNQINDTLEAMAQAIFKSWFVDFDPVHAKAKAKSDGLDAEAINRAAMAVIASKSDAELTKMKADSPAEYEQLKTLASLFPDQLEESELGMIPQGWEVSTIGQTCEFQNGYGFRSKDLNSNSSNSYKVFKMGSIRIGGGIKEASNMDYYPKSEDFDYEKFLIKKGDLLMCMTDMKNNVALLGHTALMPVNDIFLLNQRVGRIRTKNKKIVNYPFLFFLTNSNNFIESIRSKANSGVQVNLSTQAIKDSKFILPDKFIHKEFDNLVLNFLESIFYNDENSKLLTELRDALLPKLLSGEIEV